MTGRHAAKSESDAKRFWPVWDRRETRPAELAAYVSQLAVRGLGLVSDRRDLRDLDPREADSAMAERLYLTLRERRLGYALEPWADSRTRQQIRDPRWLVATDRWGTCIDFAATYAAMCLEARIGSLLAIVSGHAFVVITPGRLHALPGPGVPYPFGTLDGAEQEPGVWGFADPSSLIAAHDAGELLAIDCVAVAEPEVSFHEALARGRVQLSSHDLQLIDIPWLHQDHPNRVAPLPPPTGRPTIALHVPGGQGEFVEYDSHAQLIAELSELSGTVVLIGPPGQGKSTIARQLALRAEFGAGWFLNASEPQMLLSSLADADLAERNLSSGGLPQADRAGFAARALGRLEEADDRWVVVLDNADGDPAKLAPRLPRPGLNQLALITTTNSAWEQVPEVKVRRLPPVDNRQIAAALGGEELSALVEGRALMLHAFKRLQQSSDADSATIAAFAPADDALPARLRAPATLWAAIRSAPTGTAPSVELALCTAYLPPDHQPLDVLERLAGDASARATLFDEQGLITFEPDVRVVRMHRLFGAAVRADLEQSQPQLCDEVILRLATTTESVEALDAHGDLETVVRLADRLADMNARTNGADVDLGYALHGVGGLLEVHGHSARSGRVFALAERHLQDVPHLLADALLGQARPVNQESKPGEARLREALQMAERAEEIGDETTAGRALAMQGLLMKRLASFPREGETKLELLHQALDVLLDADDRRRNSSARTTDCEGKDMVPVEFSQVELARSRFNLAGIRIDLAQEERESATKHLKIGEEIYAEVSRIRREIYERDVHPHIAACTIGLAYVNYYRAALVPALPARRNTWLRLATDFAVDALRQRAVLDGSVDLGETRKCAEFLAKVALARFAAPSQPDGPATAVNAVAAKVLSELELAPTQSLPPDSRDLEPAIEAWTQAPTLARLVKEFGGEMPSSDVELASRLEWLEDFSARWDYRAGVERNQVAELDLSPDAQVVTMQAAHALGLVGTSAPANKRYDHILILGGLVRACFARPLQAARLMSEKSVEARSITALGGYRPLRGDELELAKLVSDREVADEFDAMDAGMRAAFHLGDPIKERGESSDEVGVSWRVREYGALLVTTAETTVRVVAAPSSEPGVRRANTADTYAWFAAELAHLRAEERILIITSDIYLPFQHADALRMLAIPYAVEVDAVGIQPGDLDRRLSQTFAPHNYLQEIRSTIRSLGSLYKLSSAEN